MTVKNGAVERSRFVRWNCLDVRSVVQKQVANFAMPFTAGEVQRSFSRYIFVIHINIWML